MLTALHSKLNIKVTSWMKNGVTDCIPSYALYKLTNYFSYCCDCFQRLEKPSDTQQWRRSTEVRWREQVPGDESFTSRCARLFSASPTPLLFHPPKRDKESFPNTQLARSFTIFRQKPPLKQAVPFKWQQADQLRCKRSGLLASD